MLVETLLRIIVVGLCCNACSSSTAPRPAPAQLEQASPVRNEPAKADGRIQSPAQGKSNQVSNDEQIDCGKNISGLIEGRKKAVQIPARLCLNSKLSIDKSEDIRNPSQGVVPPNVYDEQEVAYAQLPQEVREVIELTVGEKYSNQKFELLVIPSDDATSRKRTVKLYRYMPTDPAPDTYGTWDFKKQGGHLRFESAEFAKEKKRNAT